MNLTPRQLDVIVAIRNYRHLHGYSPTMQELADQLGTSKVTIFEHVGALEKKRVLRRDKHKARSLEIISEETPARRRPLHQAPAARQHRRRLTHRSRRKPRRARSRDRCSTPSNGVYVLRVRGDSMIEDHLCDGDLRRHRTPRKRPQRRAGRRPARHRRSHAQALLQGRQQDPPSAGQQHHGAPHRRCRPLQSAGRRDRRAAKLQLARRLSHLSD